MKVTKEKLVSLCKSLELSTTGNKDELKSKICTALCSPESASVETTLRGAIRKKKWGKVVEVANDIREMLDDDSTEASIVKSLSKLHGLKIERKDVQVFATLTDSAKMKDYDYVTEKVEEWGQAEKYGVLLVKEWALANKNSKLVEAIEEAL